MTSNFHGTSIILIKKWESAHHILLLINKFLVTTCDDYHHRLRTQHLQYPDVVILTFYIVSRVWTIHALSIRVSTRVLLYTLYIVVKASMLLTTIRRDWKLYLWDNNSISKTWEISVAQVYISVNLRRVPKPLSQKKNYNRCWPTSFFFLLPLTKRKKKEDSCKKKQNKKFHVLKKGESCFTTFGGSSSQVLIL